MKQVLRIIHMVCQNFIHSLWKWLYSWGICRYVNHTKYYIHRLLVTVGYFYGLKVCITFTCTPRVFPTILPWIGDCTKALKLDPHFCLKINHLLCLRWDLHRRGPLWYWFDQYMCHIYYDRIWSWRWAHMHHEGWPRMCSYILMTNTYGITYHAYGYIFA